MDQLCYMDIDWGQAIVNMIRIPKIP